MNNIDSAPTEEIVEITDLDSFVRALVHWHTNKVAMLKHMEDIPEGTEVQVSDDPPITLEGDTLAGFKAGIHTALAELGELPFSFEMEDEAEVPASAPAPVDAAANAPTLN